MGSILPASIKTLPRLFLTKDRVNCCAAGLVVTLLHTKTIQFGERVLHIPLLRSDSPLCPVAAFMHASDFLNAERVPAFAYKEGREIVMLTSSKFVEVFRLIMSRFNVDSNLFRGHSFRRGGASWAFNVGVPGELIQVCGDWKSDAYKVYLEFNMSTKVAIAKQISHKLLNFR